MTDFVPPVLVGIDGRPSGLEALALGSAIAVLTGSPLVLGAVYGHQGSPELVWPSKETAETWLHEAQRQLSGLIPWSTRLIVGSSPARGLTELAKLERAWVIVLGSSHRGRLGRVLAGSTCRSVAHGAQCAVAIAPRDWRTLPPDVPVTFGVGVIDSAESRAALVLAGSFAAAAHAPLKLITVVHLPSPAHPMFAATGTSYEQWCRERRKDAERIARHAIEEARPETAPEVTVLRAIQSPASRRPHTTSTCWSSGRVGTGRCEAPCSAVSPRL
jgi:nucleotide-binding universal stress UspA family protein